MRNLKRNMTEFEYLPWDGTESDLNDNGEHTGEYYPKYGDPVVYKGNISVPSGRTAQYFYGTEVRYTHVLVMDDPKTDICETGMIRWRGHLYDVTAVRPSLNALSIALREKTADHSAEMPYVPDPTPEPDPVSEPTENDGDGE